MCVIMNLCPSERTFVTMNESSFHVKFPQNQIFAPKITNQKHWFSWCLRPRPAKASSPPQNAGNLGEHIWHIMLCKSILVAQNNCFRGERVAVLVPPPRTLQTCGISTISVGVTKDKPTPVLPCCVFAASSWTAAMGGSAGGAPIRSSLFLTDIYTSLYFL